MDITRRHFFQRSAALASGFGGLALLLRTGHAHTAFLDTFAASAAAVGYGPLVKDPAGIFDLPAGFSYVVISKFGAEMSDGLLTPGLHDGMAAFPGAGPHAGKTIIVRNHELEGDAEGTQHAFGKGRERLTRIPTDAIYDRGIRAQGGTTTTVYDTKSRTVVREFLSLAGTCRNCAGGPTPWNTWLTCEESVTTRDVPGAEQDHGWVFEVPADGAMTAPVRAPSPIRAMGRMNHEAVCVDPASGVVYLTEDRHDGLIYRYLPKARGKLHEGGRLQALAIKNKPALDTRNWGAQSGNVAIAVGQTFDVEWIDLDDVEAPKDDLRLRGFAAGAARFARGEGCWFGALDPGKGAAYWACTNGGTKKLGQIWKYTPSPAEGTPDEANTPGRLTLFIEPNDSNVCANADNLTVAPWGDLVVCEDSGFESQHLFAVTPDARLYRLGRNAASKSELAGACFSPDGSTLFVNIQHPGMTLAITGPWRG